MDSCALCHEREADGTISYLPDYAEKPAPFKTGRQRRERVDIPVCNECKQRYARANRIAGRVGCVGLLAVLLALVALLIGAFAGVEESADLLGKLAIGAAAVGFGLIVLTSPVRWYIQNRGHKQISAWIQVHRPQLWREIGTVPDEDKPSD